MKLWKKDSKKSVHVTIEPKLAPEKESDAIEVVSGAKYGAVEEPPTNQEAEVEELAINENTKVEKPARDDGDAADKESSSEE